MHPLDMISILALILIMPCGAYLWFLALASIRARPATGSQSPLHRFAIAIPAHNEEAVIGHTLANLQCLDYPPDLYQVFVVADFCTDQTAEAARNGGGICLERSTGVRNGKGGALLWLFERIFERDESYDAIVVFDADTRVDAQFLKAMNRPLNRGAKAIQGKHVISNPRAGVFPCLTWAMMTIDNRFNNQGRANLNISAKIMGDSICFRADIIQSFGWGSGLTEDHDFRMYLLQEGVQIAYEPSAVGYGQAPLNWRDAESQRLRWAKGIMQVNRRYRWSLLRRGLRQMNWNMLDGAILSTMPSFSSMTLLCAVMLLLHLALLPNISLSLVWLWSAATILFFLYPLFGLFLEKAPFWAYIILLSGPMFIFWRTWLRLKLRFSKTNNTWLRTSHNARNFQG